MDVETKKTRMRLTSEQKTSIVERLKNGSKKTDLAREFGVTAQTITNVSKMNEPKKPRRSQKLSLAVIAQNSINQIETAVTALKGLVGSMEEMDAAKRELKRFVT